MGDYVASRLVELMAKDQGQTSLEVKKDDTEKVGSKEA